MIIVTTLEVQGKQIKRTLGMVRGSSIRSRHIGQDIISCAAEHRRRRSP